MARKEDHISMKMVDDAVDAYIEALDAGDEPEAIRLQAIAEDTITGYWMQRDQN